MGKLVSVIVPIYNVEKYLDRCISSILEQTYKELEIILVNDGSTDSSLKICKKWAKRDSRICIINKKNGGLSDARNFGIDKSKGFYLYFLDSDDFIANNAIELMVNKSVFHNADIVISNRYHYYDGGKQHIKFKILREDMVLNAEESLLELNNFKYYDMSACSKLFKRKIFKEIRFPYGKLCEDFYIMYKVLEKSNKTVYISDPLYYYYQRQGSITKNKQLKVDFVIAAKEQMYYVEGKYPNLKGCVRTAYASANMTIYNQVLRVGGKVEKNKRKELQKEVKNNLTYILKNDNLIIVKKIQAILFVYNIYLYDVLFNLLFK